MAKLHNYHILCPLIDQKSFIGVARDKEPEHVVITLGRNIVNKHRLSDQKQVSGWTSKDHITAPVIYNSEQDQYVGVFNNNIIKMWNMDNTHLDKLKKYKFPINILKVLEREDQPPLIIFTNGNSGSLPYAIENRKTYISKSLLQSTDEITDMGWYMVQNNNYICYIIKTAVGYEIVYCPLREELGDLQRSKLIRVKINRDESVKVIGKLIYAKDKCFVYVLWSDAKMTVYNMQTKKWKTVGIVPWISTSSAVSMAWMGQNHLIIFGSNKDQDGAIIVAYNYNLGVGSCRYPMKMYRENALLYCYDSRIILEASNHVGMLPYTLEINRNLSSLLGSHEIIQKDNLQITSWDTPQKPLFHVAPEIKETVEIGVSERVACTHSVPTFIEKKDTKALIQVLKHFKDVPESVLAAIVKYAVRVLPPIDNDEETIQVVQPDQVNANKSEYELLNEIFNVLFCDALLIPHLRNNITIDDSLSLLAYILYLLYESDIQLDADYESRLYDWCSLILDAFYQQYVISKDNSVKKALEYLSVVLNSLLKHLGTIDSTFIQLHKFLSQSNTINSDDKYMPYTIELMKI